MMKLWDVKAIRQINHEDDFTLEPSYTYRGHTGPLFALASNHGRTFDDSYLYSAGSEGVIRIWKIPPLYKDIYSKNDGKNYCVGVFSSHKDVVWQLVYHP